jgi:RimJ/RimL family protein N-acetyltransferase
MYNISIRLLKVEDANISYRWRNDPEVWKYTKNRPDRVITKEIEREWLEKTLKDNTKKRFAIIVDDKYIGNTQLTNITLTSAEYHIFIGEKDMWNKGIAKEVCKLMIKYAKEELMLHKIYFYVNPNNIASIKAHEKLGFIKETEEIKMTLKL